MNFRQRAQSRESPLTLTPLLGRHKSQSAVSGSVVYTKTAGPFKKCKERKGRGKKVRWQKTRRRHYELAMSDELFRDTNRPAATWFIDCSKKSANSLSLSLFFLNTVNCCHPEITQKTNKKTNTLVWLRADTCWFTTCWAPRGAVAREKVAVGDINEVQVNY